MKFDCGETYAEECAKLKIWHKFYPWFPRRIGSHDCRCFEWIERKGTTGYGGDWSWEYRIISNKAKG